MTSEKPPNFDYSFFGQDDVEFDRTPSDGPPSDGARRAMVEIPHGLMFLPGPAVLQRLGQELHDKIAAKVQGPVALRLNRNHGTYISVRQDKRAGAPCRVSVHWTFALADDATQAAVAQFVARPTPKCRELLRLWMDKVDEAQRQAQAQAQAEDADELDGDGDDTDPAGVPAQHANIVEALGPPRISKRLRSRGRVYDLYDMARSVAAEHFPGVDLKCRITWGRGGQPQRPGRRRHIVFGSFNHRTRVITIHPALDSEQVPEFFVRFVVFHEMIHAALPDPVRVGNRRVIHTDEFRVREEAHPDYARAVEFEKEFFKQGR